MLAVSHDSAQAQPTPNDVSVTWSAGFPKKEGGKLKYKGTVALANGWTIPDGKVYITIAPTGGGVATITPLNRNVNNWEGEIPLNGYPNPGTYHIIIPSVQAKDPVTMLVYPVAGAPKTMKLQ